MSHLEFSFWSKEMIISDNDKVMVERKLGSYNKYFLSVA